MQHQKLVQTNKYMGIDFYKKTEHRLIIHFLAKTFSSSSLTYPDSIDQAFTECEVCMRHVCQGLQ